MRAILIVGTGRSGTSAVAGALRVMGVHFCDHLIGAHPEHNPLGHFECRAWWEMSRSVVEQGGITDADLVAYHRIIRNHRQAPVWAVKDTWVPEGLGRVLPYLGGDARVIAVHRQFGACVASREKHSATSRADAERRQVEREARLFAFLAAANAPILHVDYERLVSLPETVVDLSLFAYDGLDVDVDPDKLIAAVEFIDPDLNHHQGSRD